MPAPAYQLVVGSVTLRPPRNAATHPWRRTARDGVVTVERAPGIARDASTRPPTPQETDDRDRRVYEAVMAGERCAAVAKRMGRTKNSVVGILSRYRARHALPPMSRHGVEPDAEGKRDLATRDGLVVALLRQGVPTAEVADRHGVSPRTVQGIRTRAVASGLLPPTRVTRATRVVRRGALRTVSVPVEVVRVGLLDVGPGQCRDLGDDRLCCCARTVGTTSWCAAHLALYTLPRRRAA